MREHVNTPVHPLLARRASGVLLHITSLPGRYGSGDLGASARHFLDWLARAGQTFWQILPLTPPGAGHSPYQSPSAFAGNPWLVDLDDLVACGWLAPQDDPGFDAHHCEFERVIPYRLAALTAAWNSFVEKSTDEDKAALTEFTQRHAAWLDDYAMFMVLEDRHGAPWTEWPAALASRDAHALRQLKRKKRMHGFWRRAMAF